MGINFTPSEIDQLDYLSNLIAAAESSQRVFMHDETPTGRHWFLQFRDEIVRLNKEKAALIEQARLRESREYLENLIYI